MGAQGSSNHIILGGAPFKLEKVVSITVPEISIKILISVSIPIFENRGLFYSD